MTIEPASVPARRRVRLGLWLGGIYFLFSAALFTLTALTTKPGNVGLDWIPFFLLAMPWSGMGERFMIPGILLNTVILWTVGTLVQVSVRKLRRD